MTPSPHFLTLNMTAYRGSKDVISKERQKIDRRTEELKMANLPESKTVERWHICLWSQTTAYQNQYKQPHGTGIE